MSAPGERLRELGLTLPPDAKQVAHATTLLTFAQEIRGSANYGGFAAARAKVLEKLAGLVDNYVEEILDLIKTGDAEDVGVAEQFLEVAAQFSGLIQGEKAGDLVRRRTVALLHPEPPVTFEAEVEPEG